MFLVDGSSIISFSFEFYFVTAPWGIKSFPLLYRIESLRLADSSRYVWAGLFFSLSNEDIDCSVIPDARWVFPSDYYYWSGFWFYFSFIRSANTPFKYFALAIWIGCYLDVIGYCYLAEVIGWCYLADACDTTAEDFKVFILLEDKVIESVGISSIFNSLFTSP